MGILLLLFIVVPAVELVLLIKIGGLIGPFSTVALIVFTGIVGASLAKWQGLNVLRKFQSETAQGQLPAESLVDGVFILVAGALLVTPGVLTDVVGFLCLFPPFRKLMKLVLWQRLKHSIQKGRSQFTVQMNSTTWAGADRQHPDEPIVVESRVIDDDEESSDS